MDYVPEVRRQRPEWKIPPLCQCVSGINLRSYMLRCVAFGVG